MPPCLTPYAPHQISADSKIQALVADNAEHAAVKESECMNILTDAHEQRSLAEERANLAVLHAARLRHALNSERDHMADERVSTARDREQAARQAAGDMEEVKGSLLSELVDHRVMLESMQLDLETATRTADEVKARASDAVEQAERRAASLEDDLVNARFEIARLTERLSSTEIDITEATFTAEALSVEIEEASVRANGDVFVLEAVLEDVRDETDGLQQSLQLSNESIEEMKMVMRRKEVSAEEAAVITRTDLAAMEEKVFTRDDEIAALQGLLSSTRGQVIDANTLVSKLQENGRDMMADAQRNEKAAAKALKRRDRTILGLIDNIAELEGRVLEKDATISDLHRQVKDKDAFVSDLNGKLSDADIRVSKRDAHLADVVAAEEHLRPEAAEAVEAVDAANVAGQAVHDAASARSRVSDKDNGISEHLLPGNQATFTTPSVVSVVEVSHSTARVGQRKSVEERVAALRSKAAAAEAVNSLFAPKMLHPSLVEGV